MPEGDTIRRVARVLDATLSGQEVIRARARAGGAQLGRVIGSRVERVESAGKHLLVRFDNGLTLHTHLQMRGSWHRYAPGERWRRNASLAVAVIEVPRGVAVCFDAPTVELIETRALALHPGLRTLGPDLSAPDFEPSAALSRLRAPERRSTRICEALLDQSVMAGVGNVYRSEILFIERVDPFAIVESLADETVGRLLETARQLLRANVAVAGRVTTPNLVGGAPGTGGPRAIGQRLWVYGRSGRPCRRCGTSIASRIIGRLGRRLYWCPQCQRSTT